MIYRSPGRLRRRLALREVGNEKRPGQPGRRSASPFNDSSSLALGRPWLGGGPARRSRWLSMTPAIYASICHVLRTWPRRRPVWFWGGTFLIAVLPHFLERFVPSVGPVPGRILFLVLLLCIALLAPWFMLRNPQAPNSVSARIRAGLCNGGLILCLWIVYAGLVSSR